MEEELNKKNKKLPPPAWERCIRQEDTGLGVKRGGNIESVSKKLARFDIFL
jgi:hypothetical protein